MKTIINKTYLFSIIVLIGCIINSCKKDYLEFDPIAAENSGSFYLTMNHAEQAVAAAYSTLSTRTAWDRDIYLYLGEVTSNDAEAGGDYENEVPEAEVFNRFTHTPTSTLLELTYGVLYRGIYFCNVGFERIPNIVNTDPDANPVIIERRLAELKFLRALNYLYLTHIFGQVPYVDHKLLPSEYYQDRSTFRKIFDLIEKDLTEAIPILPEKSQLASKDIGRATKGAAKALLARLYLFESSYAYYYPEDSRFEGLNERWSEVLSICEDIRYSDQYELVGIDSTKFNTWLEPETNGYRYIFTVEGENSRESIFAVQFINDGEGYTVTRAGSLTQWVSARYCDKNSKKTATGYWGLGWPTQSLVDEYDTNDIRLYVNISIPGKDSIEVTGGDRYLVNYDNTATGYYINKYELSAEQFTDASGHGWQKSPYNVMLIRYADVILMATEAAIMLKNNDKATEYINLVRKRARNCGNGVVPADFTGTITIQQLISERRRELALEGRRFFDMVRWNIAEELLNYSSTPGGFNIIYESPKHDFMPIPQREITANNGELTQHEGW